MIAIRKAAASLEVLWRKTVFYSFFIQQQRKLMDDKGEVKKEVTVLYGNIDDVKVE